MAETAFTATGVSVTQDWTTLATLDLDANHAAQALVFEIAVDAGSSAELSGVKVQARDHDSGSWHDLLGGRARIPLSSSVSTDENTPAPTLRPGHRAHYAAAVSPHHRLRIQAKALDGTATVDIYGFAETDPPMSGAVLETLFDANTILKADSDNTPVALTVAENTLIGRAGGDVDDIAVDTNQLVGRAAGDLQGIGLSPNTVIGRRGANVTDIGLTNNTLLARTDGNITSLAVAAQRIVGRVTGDNLDDLTAAQVLDIMKGTLTVPFISNTWYGSCPRADYLVQSIAYTLIPDTIYYYLFYIDQTVSIDNLGTYVHTTQAAKNMRIAIYNCDSNVAPSSLIVESGDLSLAAGADQSVPIAETELTPGLYFWAHNCDSATAKTHRYTTGNSMFRALGAANCGAASNSMYTEAANFAADPFPADATGVVGTDSYMACLKFQVV